MTHEIYSVLCGGPGPLLPNDEPWVAFDNTRNRVSPCQAYQEILERSRVDVIIYLHDDLGIHDGWWLLYVREVFREHQECVAVGLGGATGLGSKDLYRKPYNIWNLARRGYASNQTDAETHGERFGGVRRVAVPEAFAMAVRADWLRSRGGWPVGHLTHHCLDLWLACEAARGGKEIWMVGAACTHRGGLSSTGEGYAKAPWLLGGSVEEDHRRPHLWLAEEYRDVLPLEVEG